MPLPTDSKVLETSQGLLDALHGIFGPHPAHAKGILLKGVFKPTSEAAALSKAAHFKIPETPIIGRFSSSTGIPQLPDTDPNGNPRGFAIRFNLAETPRRVHTDIIAHSTPFFPAGTPDDALAFFRSVRDGSVGDYVASHAEALAFVQAPKPTPSAFGREKYFSVNAYKLVAADGTETFVRYRILPVAGEDYLSEDEVKGKSAEFLYEGVASVLGKGPVEFKLVAQVAAAGDVTNNATNYWPEDRKLVELGTLSLSGLVEDDAGEQKKIIFDPVPRVEGIEPSDDPLLEVRAGLYLLSGRERRAA
ncbi:catalase domain-containing protein [Plectosphaerella cucumerina]|uniref:Catalase domain-containing protein n=1 Tax=Plectosphaerella cucumerina TaxID=40658 RepID=A0A8K0TJ65_9PEZI|nr:catalase domain-containing protein [Plectosphaerella cucumerina]